MLIRNVTVYCSSSRLIDEVFFAAGRELGRAIASRGWGLVYGGNRVGLMGVLADAAREKGGRVIGITPQLFIDKGVADELADELIVVNGMRPRKAMMEERGDAFVVLPGGLGTFEEFFEILCGKQLGYHNKPIVLINTADYYGPMLAVIEHGLKTNFVRPAAKQLYHVAANAAEAIEYIETYVPAVIGDPVLSHSVPSASE